MNLGVGIASGEIFEIALRILATVLGIGFIVFFFRSVVRVGLLSQRYQDPLAFWVGRLLFDVFRFRVARYPQGDPRRSDIMAWYWPSALIGLIVSWFLLVTFGFAFLNWAWRENDTFTAAIVSSGSALSTLGFSTPTHLVGQLLAIFEGAIGLFLIVYLFTFLPGFMTLIKDRGNRVKWIYTRTGPEPSGVELILWFFKNNKTASMDALWDEWENFFNDLSQARSFLPILCVIRPLGHKHSWVCAFGAFLDALALLISTVKNTNDSSRFCFDAGVNVIKNFHSSMRGTPVHPIKSPELMHVEREYYDIACAKLIAAGVPLEADIELAWNRFIQLHMLYEEEIAWLAAALADPTPFWPKFCDTSEKNPAEALLDS